MSKTNDRVVDRALRVRQQWVDHPGKNIRGEYTSTSGGVEVRITKIEYGSGDGLSWVDVWVGSEPGSPAFRICNPPLLVSDPGGPIEGTVGGSPVRFREDPVEAVARAVSFFGGRR